MSYTHMKVIGLLGGMSWESTTHYYKIINETVRERLGGLHSARLVLYSVDFAPIADLQHKGDWAGATEELINASKQLAAAGADCLVICTNTMHKVADPIASAINIPLLHIADATAERLKARGISRVGLLGTRFTMEQDFYRGRWADYGCRDRRRFCIGRWEITSTWMRLLPVAPASWNTVWVDREHESPGRVPDASAS